MDEKILLVDDEPHVLQAIQRQLRKRFTIVTAESGREALAILRSQGPFAVIVSDMRMPAMDGVQLLASVKEAFPDTVRIMLTGNADQQTAVEAVNTGQIFRFLTKPCSTAVFVTSLVFAIRQYKLIIAENELLNKTLKGSIAAMVELLALTNAIAFSSGRRIEPIVTFIAQELQLADPWQYEIAALVSQIGCITLPPDVLCKVQGGVALDDDEEQMYANHPRVGSRFIQKIPRLEKVAAIIERQFYSFSSLHEGEFLPEEVVVGAEILKLLIDYDLLCQRDCTHQQAIEEMEKRDGEYNLDILNLLKHYRAKKISAVTRDLFLKEITAGMVAVDDVLAKNGTLLISKNQEITWSIIHSLANFEKHIGVVEPIRMRMVEDGGQEFDE